MIAEQFHVVVVSCCREYLAPLGFRGSRCLYCGKRPTFDREVCCNESYQCPTTGDVECGLHGGFDVCCYDASCPGRRQW